MRPTALLLASLIPATTALGSEPARTLHFSHVAAGVTEVVVESGVGDIEVIAGNGADISAEVKVTPKGGGWWSGSRSARELDALELHGDVHGQTLVLHVAPAGSHDHDFGEDWSVQLPKNLAVTLKVGVGDVRVLDVSGDVEVKLGVGDVQVEGDYASFGAIHAACGVGDAEMRSPEGRVESEGFIGHTLDGHGTGKATISIKTGVGDVKIRLR